MIRCIKFSDVEDFLHELGLDLAGESDSHFFYESPTDQITVHNPNIHAISR